MSLDRDVMAHVRVWHDTGTDISHAAAREIARWLVTDSPTPDVDTFIGTGKIPNTDDTDDVTLWCNLFADADATYAALSDDDRMAANALASYLIRRATVRDSNAVVNWPSLTV